MNTKNKILLYDTTLRDGSQAEGVSFSLQDKLRIAEKLDQLGIEYIEGGWPSSNPKDMAFFHEIRHWRLKQSRIVAFGSTRRARRQVENDENVISLLEAETPAIAIFGKSWLLHVTDVLRVSPDTNLAMIRETVGYLKEKGKEMIYDAEHFFDAYRMIPAMLWRLCRPRWMEERISWLSAIPTAGAFRKRLPPLPKKSEGVSPFLWEFMLIMTGG
jgi:2-isopropylmalate synthase